MPPLRIYIVSSLKAIWQKGPRTALERFTEEHITLQNQIKFNIVVTDLEINFF